MTDRTFQILILDEPIQENRFSQALQANIASVKSLYPDHEYHLFTDSDILDFLSDEYPNEVLDAYNALIPKAFKSDLARYCLMYRYGGLYSDLSYLHLQRMHLKPGKDLIVFRDIAGHPSWATSTSVLYGEPQQPVFDRAINRILKHHHDGYLGADPLDPTGPYLLGRVLAEGEDWQSVEFGDGQMLSRQANGRANIVKILSDGQVIAMRNKNSDSTISDLVGVKTENYAQLWRKKQVWKTDKGAPRIKALFGL